MNLTRVSAVLILYLSSIILIIASQQGASGSAEPAYGVHITTDSGKNQAFYLALENDDVIVFKNWKVELYGKENSSYSMINEITSELYAYGNFSYHTQFNLKITENLVTIIIEIDSNLIERYQRIRIKQNGEYTIYEREEIETKLKHFLLTNVELFWRDLKVSLGSILALGLAFQWRYGKYKKSAMMEVNDLV